MTINDSSPFTDLPQALVEQMFSVSRELASGIVDHINQIQNKKDKLRNNLKDRIRLESEIIHVPQFPTSAGVDGSYCADKLLATDFVAMAGVAVEGLVPPKLEEPLWGLQYHFLIFIYFSSQGGTIELYFRSYFCLSYENHE